MDYKYRYRVFILGQGNSTQAVHDVDCQNPESAIDVAQMLYAKRFPPDQYGYVVQDMSIPVPLTKAEKKKLRKGRSNG